MNIYNQNFYNELSLCLTPEKYNKVEPILTNKKQYLNMIVDSPYKDIMLPHLPLEDILYIHNLLNGVDMITLFVNICSNGYEDKVRCICYYIDFYKTRMRVGVEMGIIKSVIPHQNIELLSFLLEYFCYVPSETTANMFVVGYQPVLRHVFRDILTYNVLCLELFNHEILDMPDDILYKYILQSVFKDRYKIFAYLFDFFNVSDNKSSVRLNNFLISIMDECVIADKLSYVKYIHNTNRLSDFYTGTNVVHKIQSFEMFDYLRTKVKSKNFERLFFYKNIKEDNKLYIEKIIEINPYLICVFDHKSIHLAPTEELKIYLKKHHQCNKQITIKNKTWMRTISNLLYS